MKSKKAVNEIEVVEPIIVMSEPMPKILIEEKQAKFFIEEKIVTPKNLLQRVIHYFKK